MKVKTEVSGLVRDTENNALLNSDVSKLAAYKIAKKKSFETKELQEASKQMAATIAKINDDIADIRAMMHMIIELRTPKNDNNCS